MPELRRPVEKLRPAEQCFLDEVRYFLILAEDLQYADPALFSHPHTKTAIF
jgi:hypothetical protein